MKIKEYNKLIGSRIKFFRKLRGLSQVELAQRLGYTSTGTISRIERDGSGMDKAKIVEAAKVLHVHPYVLSSEETLTGDQLILLNKFMSLMLSKDTDNFKEIAQSILSK